MPTLLERAKSIPRGIEVIHDWLGEGGIPVDKGLAQSRADICLKCPYNQPNNGLALYVAEMVRKHVEVKNNLGIRVHGERDLHECGLCLCQLRLKVHVPIAVVKRHMIEGEEQTFPDHCWQKLEQP